MFAGTGRQVVNGVAGGRQVAQGLFFDNDVQTLFGIGADFSGIVATDAQNALLVRGTAGEREFAQQLSDLPADKREQLIDNLRRLFAETAFWDAHIVTDEKGIRQRRIYACPIP